MSVETNRPATCRCCGAHGQFREVFAREMLFGTREPFTYLECPACRSLQISEVPADLARYYSSEYYSLQPPAGVRHTRSFAHALAGRVLALRPARPLTTWLRDRYPFLHWANLCGVNPRSSILDIGCGAGVWLRRLRRWGYRNLTGLDPYLQDELHEPGLDLYRKELAEVPGRFDLVMMHHVLEHLPDAVGALRVAATRLGPGSHLLVRIPIADSPLAREYGIDWFNFEAPRHLVIPSRTGALSWFAQAGLRLVHEEYDSHPLTIFYSDNYRRNIAHAESIPWREIPDNPAARRRIARLNADQQGDCGVFILERAEPPADISRR